MFIPCPAKGHCARSRGPTSARRPPAPSTRRLLRFRKLSGLAFLAAYLTFGAGTASGDVAVYNGPLVEVKAQFLADTGAHDATGPMEGVPHAVYADVPQTIGEVEFLAHRWGTAEWTDILCGSTLGISKGFGDVATEDLDVQLAQKVSAIGFDFVEGTTSGCGTGCTDSTFEVTLLNGGSAGTPVGSFTFNAPDDVAAFVGVTSTSAFDYVTIRETTGTNDNEL